MRVVFAFPWLPSKVTTTLCTFFARTVSVGLTLKTGLSTWNVNCVACGNTFLKGMEALAPALIVYGPCGLGGAAKPYKGKVYSPPIGDDSSNVARELPRQLGSYVTSTLTSVPPLEAEAAVMDLSTWKSGLST